jgi:hypothetical protein
MGILEAVSEHTDDRDVEATLAPLYRANSVPLVQKNRAAFGTVKKHTVHDEFQAFPSHFARSGYAILGFKSQRDRETVS